VKAKTRVPPTDTGAGLKARVIGLLCHGRGKDKSSQPYIYLTTPRFNGSTNVNLEALRRTLEDLGLEKLPPRLHVQLDNTSKDNKNNMYVLALIWVVSLCCLG